MTDLASRVARVERLLARAIVAANSSEPVETHLGLACEFIGAREDFLSLLADRARMEKALELLCEVYEAARDVSMAAVQDDDGEWSIKGDPEAMLGRLYLATEEVRKVTKGASQ